MKNFAALIILTFTGIHVQFGQVLPRGLTDAERQILAEGYFRPGKPLPGMYEIRSLDTPPRAMAEWEELQAIVITWTGYPAILREIVRHAQKEVRVLIITLNEQTVRNHLIANGIEITDRIEFVHADYNSVWIRDYGANPAYIRDVDSLVLIDWIYNRPRPKDDLIPFAIGEYLDVPVFSTTEAPDDLVNTGGNFMSDGLGRGFSSELVLYENGPGNMWGTTIHDEAAIDDIMHRFMGIREYVKMPNLPYDAIHHIDMHIKLLDEETLLVGQYPEGIADGPQIEANLLYVIEQFKVATGRDYRIIRIPMPPDHLGRYPDNGGLYRTYANSMIINNTILVPTYAEQYDTTALRIWREAMPGYTVEGINCNQIIPAFGALHCIIKEVGAHRPLWISHFQPRAVEAGVSPVVEAEVRHVSGIEQVYAFYRLSEAASYDSVAMERVDGDTWSADLSMETSEGDIVHYYFKARAMDGKTITRPLPAPEGYFRLEISEPLSSSNNDLTIEAGMEVFPNPAHAMTCIRVHLPVTALGSLTIRDLYGRSVATLHHGGIRAGETRYFFNASDLPAGYYFVDLATDTMRRAIPLAIH